MPLRRREQPAPTAFGNGLHRPVRADEFEMLLEQVRREPLPHHDETFRVDWMGVRTRLSMMPWTPEHLHVEVYPELPIPTDMYRSEAEEYIALALSVLNDRPGYRIIEIGAAWAPWAVAGIVVARNLGKQACGIAVEADETRAQWAMQHAKDNGIDAIFIDGSSRSIREQITSVRSDAEMLVVRAACWFEETTLRFPVLDGADMGGAATPEAEPNTDYRGAHLPHIDVPTVTLTTLLGDQPTDLLHVDLQGRELDVLLPNISLIEQRVRLLAVGTHDRFIEGQLQQTLLPREWGLLLDSPSTCVFDGVRPTLAGFTVQDGNQLYANSQFRDTSTFITR